MVSTIFSFKGGIMASAVHPSKAGIPVTPGHDTIKNETTVDKAVRVGTQAVATAAKMIEAEVDPKLKTWCAIQ